jgi:hypothetical protein
MEENRSRLVSSERGVALVVVLVAIVVLLPPTILLSALAIRWQRQTIDLRDGVEEDFAAHAGLEEARNRIASTTFGLAPNEATAFVLDELGDVTPSVRIAREEDVVLTLDGGVLEGPAAAKVNLEQTGVDAEGRVVYQYRKLEIYVVEVDVKRRPTLRAVKLEGVIARLPDSSVQTLGVKTTRGFWPDDGP